MGSVSSIACDLSEQGLVPDQVVRHGIRRLLRQRLREIRADDIEEVARAKLDHIRAMDMSPLALKTDIANEQHYELPTRFFQSVLGPRLKYSSCCWPEGTEDLAGAEEQALETTCERAGLENGMDILELGCGWGALSLWMAEKYPASHIVAVSNSASQRQFIQRKAAIKGLGNLQVLTRDMNDFGTQERFDRVVSLEMFEHMRNHRRLFQRVASWLKPGGRFFMHIFVHRDAPYFFEDQGEDDWMSRHFFSGGMMPSDDLPHFFQDEMALISQWRWNGRHYARTLDSWLHNMDVAREELMPVFQETYGIAARQWWSRWRMFFMACSELFAFNEGREWWVSHYLFEKRQLAAEA